MTGEGDSPALGWAAGPAVTKELDLVVGIAKADAANGQMEVAQGGEDVRAGRNRGSVGFTVEGLGLTGGVEAFPGGVVQRRSLARLGR